MDRASFSSSAVRKISKLDANGEVEALRKVFSQIRKYNAENKKPLFADKHSVWKFSPEEAKNSNEKPQDQSADLNGNSLGNIAEEEASGADKSAPLPATIRVDGVDRPTTNSNGKPIAQTDEGLRNFWRWFGDSKVVDADGRPMVVYHGTTADFDAFGYEARGTNTQASGAERGFFFAGNKSDSHLYIEIAQEKARKNYEPEPDGRIIEAYLRAGNPVILTPFDEANVDEDTVTEIIDSDPVALDYAIDNGYDAVIWPHGNMNNSAYTAVVFNPTQIKSAIGNNGEFSPENPDIRYSKQRKDSSNLALSDKAVYGMVAEGKSSVEILGFIASASRNPFNRQLAKLLIKTDINPKVVAGTADGWKFNTGNDKRYAAAYNPKSDTTALFRPASAERNFLHESVHAATIRALEKKGLASAQMNALFKHVKNSGALNGMYGMSNVDEFVAEAFTNPKFQAALKNVKAPVSTSSLGNAWNWFVRVVRGILGLPSSRDDALSKAIDLGIGVMQEDKALRAAGSDSGKVRFSADKPPKKASESLPKPSESTDGLNEIFAGLDSRGLKKGRAISALESRKDADRIQYIQDNFIDILAKLEDAGQIKINCD